MSTTEATAARAPAAPVAVQRAGLSRLARKEAISFYLFISPWLVGFLAFTLGPMVASLVLSLASYDVITPAVFTGLRNYQVIFTTDAAFFQSLKVTLIYTAMAVPVSMVAALLVAILMNQAIRGITFFRTFYYLPSVITGVPVAILWVGVLTKEGVLNSMLSVVGIEGPSWLFDEFWVLPAFVIMGLWGVGGGMIIYLASLQGIPQHLYEAAEVDGAGTLTKFWNVTLPMISPVVFFNLVMSIIGSFQVFTSAFVMTNGGPNNATLFYVLYLYRNAFQYFKMGYASALAWVLFVIIMLFTLLVIRSSPAWVYYEGMTTGRQR